MIHSSAALAADDVSVKCRVRRSETVSDPVFDSYVDMSCTMRNWANPTKQQRITANSLKKTLPSASDPSSRTAGMISECNGPELLLHPTSQSSSDHGMPIFVQEQVRSFGSRSRQNSGTRSSSIGRRRIWAEVYAPDDREQEEPKEAEPYSIPVYDVVVVDTMGCRNYTAASIFLTTSSMGYFEFTFPTANAHDIFMAFLTNTLPYERICKASSTPTCFDSADSFDVETLTAKRMHERVEAETLTDKMRRKLIFMANRMGELSQNLSEACACGCVPESPKKTSDGRQSPPRTFEFPTELEVEAASVTGGSAFSP